MYFWLKNSRFLAVRFAIAKIGLFFYLCYNVHFNTSDSSTLGKEGCQISRQTEKSFGRYGTPWEHFSVKYQISNFLLKTGVM